MMRMLLLDAGYGTGSRNTGSGVERVVQYLGVAIEVSDDRRSLAFKVPSSGNREPVVGQEIRADKAFALLVADAPRFRPIRRTGIRPATAAQRAQADA